MSLLFILVALAAGLGIGYAVAALLHLRKYRELEIELVGLKAKAETVTAAREELEKTFKAVAGDVLRDSNKSFLELATQNLGKFQTEARGDFDKRQQAFAELIKPISETLKKTETQIHEIEKERKEAYGNITSHLKMMAQGQQQLETETRNLVTALRRPEVRGRWGEFTLRRLAELAGMVDRCDFYEQEHHATESGAMRPDMIVRLPDKRELVVDAKTPLDSYLAAIEAKDSETRDAHLVHHARKVRERIKELASKRYWDQFSRSPDFVILFIPGDQFLSAALDREPGLIDEALQQKVMLATPTSLVALLKAVAYGWRQVALAENAELIRKLATDLHDRLATFSGHLVSVGSGLGKAIDNYNKAIGSFEHNVLPGARKFTELGVQSRKDIPELNPIEITPRLPQSDDDSE